MEGTNQEAPSLTINGGTFSGGLNTIKNDDGATLVIEGGEFANTTQAVVQNNHIATINGGTFSPTNGFDAVQNRHFDGDHNKGEITITGGTFNGNLLTTEGATWIITGGTFSSEPNSSYLAEGYTASKNETTNVWTVVKNKDAKTSNTNETTTETTDSSGSTDGVTNGDETAGSESSSGSSDSGSTTVGNEASGTTK